MAKCSGSLQPTLGHVDPNLKRPHQWEYTAIVQHQIGQNTSVSVGYYGRQFGDLYTTVNAAGAVLGLHAGDDHEPAQQPAVDGLQPGSRDAHGSQNLVTTIPDLKQTYNGVEFQVNTRLTKATLFGGLTLGRDYGDNDSGDLNNPNVRINNTGYLGFDSPVQIRGGFTYRLPADVQFAGSIREASGLPQARTFTVTTTRSCRD